MTSLPAGSTICSVCGSGSAAVAWKSAVSLAIRCKACNVITDRSGIDLNRFYDESYYAQSYLPRSQPLTAFFESEIRRIHDLRPQRGRLLDVGCGIGLFLEVATTMGWTAIGIDPSEDAVQLAQNHGRSETRASTLVEAGFPDRWFDVITYWDVLAHVKDVRSELTEARRVLADDGLLIIKTPHHPRRAFSYVRATCWLKPSTGDHLLHLPQQVAHFSPRTLAGVLEQIGFTMSRWRKTSEVRSPESRRRSMRSVATSLLRFGFEATRQYESFVAYAAKTRPGHGVAA